MNHKMKMIGLDLDGTLLTTEKKMTAYTKNVLEKALAAGVEVLVSTGRSITAVPKDVLAIPGMKYAVTSNGARVLNIVTEEVLHASMISVEKAEQILIILKKYDVIAEIFIDGVCYAEHEVLKRAYEFFDNPSMAEYIINTRVPVKNVMEKLHEANVPVDKVHVIFCNLDEKKAAYEELQKIDGLEIASAYGNNLEVNKEGTDKGKGLLRLGETLGICREEIMACGDGMNDYEMLKAVGFAVAMENGHPKVKEIADYITQSNDEDGVAKAIEKFVL